MTMHIDSEIKKDCITQTALFSDFLVTIPKNTAPCLRKLDVTKTKSVTTGSNKEMKVKKS